MATLAQTPQEITRKIDSLILLLEGSLVRAKSDESKYVYNTSILFYKELTLRTGSLTGHVF